MPDTLYHQDALAWSEQQADLLRRLAAGERINDTPDWVNIVEEIHDVGLAELHSCQSLLARALEHLMKLHLEPDSQAAAHWRREVRVFLDDAHRRFSPSMQQRIGLTALYDRARLAALEEPPHGIQSASIPQGCPYTLDDLFAPQASPASLAARLATP